MKSTPYHLRAEALRRRIARSVTISPSYNGCWIWLLTLDRDGYGSINIGHVKTARAHRVSFEAFRGKIPEDLTLDHLCQNKSCVNPWHLEAVTNAENTRRKPSVHSINSKKTSCKHGHPFDETNTRIISHRGGWVRVCRECDRLAQQRYAAQRRALEVRQ